MATTTPPPSSPLNVPETPRFGTFEDNYQPYALRKSTRISQRAQRAALTPSSHRRTRHCSPTSATSSMTTSPQSPGASKRTTKSSLNMSKSRASGVFNDHAKASPAGTLSLDKKDSLAPRALTSNGMLPTPAKTPVKRPAKVASAISTIARNLFPVRTDSTVDELMPTPKKKGSNKYSLAIFGESEEEAPIQIYTDSQDRIPEVDESQENPFYGKNGTNGTVAATTTRASKRRKVSGPGEAEQTMEEAQKRDDGMVYVFRGKKIFRKFSEPTADDSIDGDSSDAELDIELDTTVPARLRGGPLTRSSVKPRLLFPTAEQIAAGGKKPQTAVDDEEADTDIEDVSNESSTPHKMMRKLSVTPSAPEFTPASPPTTARATRSRKVDEMIAPKPSTPTKSANAKASAEGRGRAEKTSPYDAWQRTKVSSKKRGGASLTRSGGDVSKRQRGEVA